MKTGMRPGSESDTGAEYKSYGATTLEGRHIVKKADGSVVARFVPGKKKGQEIEMPINDTKLASQLLQKSQKVGKDIKIGDDILLAEKGRAGRIVMLGYSQGYFFKP